MTDDPFAALGLPAVPGLTDEQVRAAWRALAAATHPDRTDGGHPARYAAASAAYAQLRTGWGRSEALADLAADREPAATPFAPIPADAGPPPGTGAVRMAHAIVMLPARVRYGRPFRLLIRAVIASAASLGVLALVPGRAAAPGTITMLITWFVLTGRCDLAARAR
ncbi:MAG: hypothetical protein ACRDOL_25720 [Streptosporangiaceae bacterium]